MPRRNTPDHSYFDSVITQLELSVVSQFSDGREKEHLSDKEGKSCSIVCDQLGTPTEAYDEEGKACLGSRAGHLWADRGTGLDAHPVGQKARMSNLVANNDLNKAPAILVPASGHSSKNPVRGRLATSAINPRTKKPFANARELLARDIRELRRVYPEIPNSQLQELIDLNKSMYPEMNKPPRGKH